MQDSPVPEMLFCNGCRELVPASECSVIEHIVSAAMPTDSLPEFIHVRKHTRTGCKRLIYLPGKAPR